MVDKRCEFKSPDFKSSVAEYKENRSVYAYLLVSIKTEFIYLILWQNGHHLM